MDFKVRRLATCGDAVAASSPSPPRPPSTLRMHHLCMDPRGLEDRIFEARGLVGLARLLGLLEGG